MCFLAVSVAMQINKDNRPDVAVFDFTSIYAAENSTRIQEKHGHRLMLTLVGDSLLEVRRLFFFFK